MKTEIIHEACRQSITNNLPFPEVVKRLTQADVESYYADLGQLQKTYYGSDGEICVSRMVMEPLGLIGDQFDAKLTQEAIQAIMQRKITYVEFLRRIARAGTFAYTVHIRGRKAIYLGRAGDFHVEHFPSGN